MPFLLIVLSLAPAVSRAQAPSCAQQINSYLSALNVKKKGAGTSVEVRAMRQNNDHDKKHSNTSNVTQDVIGRLRQYDGDRNAELGMGLVQDPFHMRFLYTRMDTFSTADDRELQVYYNEQQAVGFLLKPRLPQPFRRDVGFSFNSDCSVKLVYGNNFPADFRLQAADCEIEWITQDKKRTQLLPWSDFFDSDKICKRRGGTPRTTQSEAKTVHECDCPDSGCVKSPEDEARAAFHSFDRPFIMTTPSQESVNEAKRLCEIAFGRKAIESVRAPPAGSI